MDARRLTWLLVPAFSSLALVGAIPSLFLWITRVAAEHDREELVASLGPCRPIEGRLSVGLQYAPYDETNGGISRAQSKTAQRLQKLQISDPHLPAQYAALVKVLGGRPSEALSIYEEILQREPQNGEVLSDLAALALAEPMNADPKHNLRALQLARRAVVLAPEYLPARFNLALAFEKNLLHRKAITAWRDYLARDPSSSWGREARSRQDSLSRPSLREAWLAKVGDVESLLSRTDVRGLSEIVIAFPEFATTYASDTVLREWAEAWLRGDRAAAEEQERKAGLLGKTLSETIGESMVIDIVDAIHGTDRSPNVARKRTSLAQGQILLAAGKDLCLGGESTKGRRVLESASHLLASANSPSRLWADTFIAICAYKDSAYSESLRRLKSILDSRSRIHDRYPSLEAKIYWIKGLCYISSGEPSHAIESYERASFIYQHLNFIESMGAISYLLSENLRFLGEPLEAWKRLFQGLDLTVRVGDPWRTYTAFNNAAEAASLSGYHRESLDFWDEVVSIALLTPDSPSLTHAFLKHGETQFQLGHVSAALKDLAEAQRYCKAINDPAARRRAEADILLVSGKGQCRLSPTRSLAELERALALYKRDGYVISDLDTYRAKAKVLTQLNRIQEAEKALLSGIEDIEHIRSKVIDDRLRILYLSSVRDLFDQMILLQAKKGGGDEISLRFAEESRARVLGEQIRASRKAADAPLFRQACAEVGVGRSLPQGSVLLEYALLEDRLLIWIIRRGRGVALRQITLSSAELETQVSRLESEVHSTTQVDKDDAAAAWLYDRLILPVQMELGKNDLLIIAADKALQRVPFSLLWNRREARFLVEDHAISNTPSCAILLSTVEVGHRRPRDGQKRILIIGNPVISRTNYAALPSLPGAELEARDVAHLYEGSAKLATGLMATGDELLKKSGNYEIVHIAAHTIGNPLFPYLARLILAPSQGREDGAVYVHEIRFFQPSNTQLVVLATCGTVSSYSEDTEVQLVFARAFLAAGVPSVVSNLWQSDDKISRILFLNLYRSMNRGHTPAEALRGAQLALLHSGDRNLRRPSAWAGLELFGGLTPVM